MKVKKLNLRDCPVKSQYLVDYTPPPEFFKVKGDIEDIQTTINQLQALRDSIIYDERAIEDFETVSRKRDEKKEEFKKLESECDTHERDLRIGFQEWHKELSIIVKIMNEKFNKFLNLGYYNNNNRINRNNNIQLASVQLIPSIIDGNLPLKDYLKVMDNCQIIIQAKLKSFERMRDITSHTLSGGERAFSVSLFLLSLRSVILSPFCFMDEINQGMDEEYEIDFFRILLSDPKPDTQYFIISPTLNMKLDELLCKLNEKELLPHMTCNIILNGDHIPNIKNNSDSDSDNDDDNNGNGLLIVLPDGVVLDQNPYFNERRVITPKRRRRSNNNNEDNEEEEEEEEIERPNKKRQKRKPSEEEEEDTSIPIPLSPPSIILSSSSSKPKQNKRNHIITSDDDDEDVNISDTSISDEDDHEEEIKPKKRKQSNRNTPTVYKESITPVSKRNMIISESPASLTDISDDSQITCISNTSQTANVTSARQSPVIVMDNHRSNGSKRRTSKRKAHTF